MGTIIFDLDGTLIDSAPDIHAVLNAALAPLGVAPLSLERVRTFVGRGAPTLVQRACNALEVPEVERQGVLDRFLERYATAVDLTRPYPHAVDALDTLRAAGHRLGLCTNKPIDATRFVLEHFDLAGRMDVVIGGDSLPVRKPDPATLRAVMDGMNASSCLYVGDSETDCETASAAEMPFALFTEGYRTSPAEDLTHRAAFADWSRFPDLAQAILAEG